MLLSQVHTEICKSVAPSVLFSCFTQCPGLGCDMFGYWVLLNFNHSF